MAMRPVAVASEASASKRPDSGPKGRIVDEARAKVPGEAGHALRGTVYPSATEATGSADGMQVAKGARLAEAWPADVHVVVVAKDVHDLCDHATSPGGQEAGEVSLLAAR